MNQMKINRENILKIFFISTIYVVPWKLIEAYVNNLLLEVILIIIAISIGTFLSIKYSAIKFESEYFKQNEKGELIIPFYRKKFKKEDWKEAKTTNEFKILIPYEEHKIKDPYSCQVFDSKSCNINDEIDVIVSQKKHDVTLRSKIAFTGSIIVKH